MFTAKRSLVGGVQFELSGLPEQLTTKRDYRFELGVSDTMSGPVALETIMGAKGTWWPLMPQRDFTHMHPVDSIAGAAGSDELAFLFNVPNPGWYRVLPRCRLPVRKSSGALICRWNNPAGGLGYPSCFITCFFEPHAMQS